MDFMNRGHMDEIDNLATNAHNMTVRRRTNADLTITIDATTEGNPATSTNTSTNCDLTMSLSHCLSQWLYQHPKEGSTSYTNN